MTLVEEKAVIQQRIKENSHKLYTQSASLTTKEKADIKDRICKDQNDLLKINDRIRKGD